MGKATCCDNSKVKRGSWSPEEDKALKAYVEKNGIGGNWISLPQKAELKRCGRSCRLRWLNYLRPDIRHGGYTEEESIGVFIKASTITPTASTITINNNSNNSHQSVTVARTTVTAVNNLAGVDDDGELLTMDFGHLGSGFLLTSSIPEISSDLFRFHMKLNYIVESQINIKSKL